MRTTGTHPARPGQGAEALLAAQLTAAGHEVIDYRTWLWRALDGTRYEGWVREFPVGIMLAPTRRYRADLFCPSRRLIVECKGAAHIAGRAKLRQDNEREGLLVAAGLRVLPINPGDTNALALIARAVEG
jgi:hypothetical protein